MIICQGTRTPAWCSYRPAFAAVADVEISMAGWIGEPPRKDAGPIARPNARTDISRAPLRLTRRVRSPPTATISTVTTIYWADAFSIGPAHSRRISTACPSARQDRRGGRVD
jgi:hypothetical protein